MKAIFPLVISLVCGIVTARGAGAAEPAPQQYPSFSDLATESQDAALSMNCGPMNEPTTIHCHGVSVSVSRQSETEIKKKQTEALDRFSKLAAEKLKTAKNTFCDRFKEDDDDLKKGGVRNREFKLKRMSLTKQLCQSSSRAAFARTFAELVGLEGKLCTISESLLQVNFVKTSESQWTASTPPQGPCKTVALLTIENAPKSPYLWTFTERSAPTDLREPACQKAESHSVVFSYKVPRMLGMSCEYIQFGSD